MDRHRALLGQRFKLIAGHDAIIHAEDGDSIVVLDVQANGVAGPLTLALQSTYNGAGETYPIVLGTVPCASNLSRFV